MAVETCDKTSLGESSAAYHSGWTIVTGASGSIGAALTEGLAAQGYSVVMACRNLKKAEPIRQQIMERSGNDRIVLRGGSGLPVIDKEFYYRIASGCHAGVPIVEQCRCDERNIPFKRRWP